jgi:hypothetical protein
MIRMPIRPHMIVEALKKRKLRKAEGGKKGKKGK